MVTNNIKKDDLIKIKDYLNNDYYRSSFFISYIFDNYLYDIIVYILGICKNSSFSIYIDFSLLTVTVLLNNKIIHEKSLEFNINHYFQTHLETIIKINFILNFNENFYIENKGCFFYTSNNMRSLNYYDDDGEIYCEYIIDLNYDNINNIKRTIFAKVAENLQISIAINYFEQLNINKSLKNMFINNDYIFEYLKMLYFDDNISINEKIEKALKEKHINKKTMLKLNKIMSYK